jgi:Tol biopolymer transport system component
MNMEEKIKQCLMAAPKPQVPDSLVDRLRKDIILKEVQARESALRRFFAPSGERISHWRVAAAIAVMVLLPLSYGATKLIKRFATISQLPANNVDFSGSGISLSPDGRHFAGVTEDAQLVIIDTSTGEKRKLIENCSGPSVWSADGSEIAVIKRSDGEQTILAVSSETGKTRSLMENPRRTYFQDWSSGGKFILAVRIRNTADHSVVLINLENKEEIILAEDTGVWSSPRFSPKGDWVSYVTKEAGRTVLHLRQIDGTCDVKYTDFPGEISQPLWSPDGSHVVFTGMQRGISRKFKDLWALRFQSNQFVGTCFPVVPDVEQMEFYNWSQNGQLAYRAGFELGGIFILPMDLQTGKAAGSLRQLVRRGGLGSHCWSPDGKQIAMLNGNYLSFISAGSGENIRNLSLSEIEYIGRGMSWSPDGKQIAFCGRDPTMGTGIFLITVETSEVKLQVSLRGLPNLDPTWSPDSKTIAYGYRNDIYIVKIEEGKPQRITPPSENQRSKSTNRPVFTHDGNSVAYLAGFEEKFGEKILETTIDGQETREIFSLKEKKWGINIFDLSPDGRHIVFTPGNNEIWCAPTNGGEPFKIGDVSNLGSKAWVWMPKWSPTGDAIAFIVTCEKNQYWVMENFLPAK